MIPVLLVTVVLPESVAESETIIGNDCLRKIFLGDEQPADTVEFWDRSRGILNTKMRFCFCPTRVSNPPKIRVDTVKVVKVNLYDAVVEVVIR